MARRTAAIRAGHRAIVLLAAVAFLPVGPAPRAAKALQRIVSINACTDQLLWALADRGQIAAMTNYAANPAYSLTPDEIASSGVPLIRGEAEEVLKLKPDLVLAGSFTRTATRQRLKAFGLRLETYAPAESIAAAKTDIRRTALMIGQPARGEALIAEIDAALAEARAAIGSRPLRLLQLRRNAYISGKGTLFDDALNQLGLANAGVESGLKGTRQGSLEAVLKIQPDALVMFDAIDRPGDQGSALLFHPGLRDSFPEARRVIIDGNEIVCGGPSLPRLLRSLARGVRGLAQ
ncbi:MULTISPECIES: ABC transporter substrate-binding protein [Rhodomicrobium]|uniref:ABC transporter substrate-binding protein n=1 Tax=Rhodomicrobium TaxID=1068 RepID=UPI0014835466|nr:MULTISPECIES: ABC transporter substrate-binding protein [Rhodomicrobium]